MSEHDLQLFLSGVAFGGILAVFLDRVIFRAVFWAERRIDGARHLRGRPR